MSYQNVKVYYDGSHYIGIKPSQGSHGAKRRRKEEVISVEENDSLVPKEKEIKKTVMNIVTDCKGLEDPKDPDSCNVFALYKLFASEEEIAEMRQNYLGGNYGYGHAKKALFEKMWSFFEPMRKRRAELEADPGYVEEILRKNGEIAREEALKLMKKVRSAVGL